VLLAFLYQTIRAGISPPGLASGLVPAAGSASV
jgi:hypothetical protein